MFWAEFVLCLRLMNIQRLLTWFWGSLYLKRFSFVFGRCKKLFSSDTMKGETYDMEVRLDELAQYSRRDCREITGIPVVPTDNPAKLVDEVAQVIGVQLDPQDISIAHRLPSTTKVKDRLIVKFTRREKRDEFYKKRFKLKTKTTKDLPTIKGQPLDVNHKAAIHVNESLTPYRKRLFGEILKFKRNNNYNYLS